jgi:hypothetical protein
MALLSCWYRDYLRAETHAVVPYAHALGKLPSYLEQLEMESNGKSVRLDGSPVDQPTSPVVWGTAGTNGQHAYFQMLHQGTALVPLDLIGFVRAQPGRDLGSHQDLLVANLLAQAEALAFGRTAPEVVAAGVPAAQVPHRTFPGNRPSSVLLTDELTPHTLGALIAAYEHKVLTLGVLWNIDSFDQWGVELGKELAGRIVAEIEADPEPRSHDSSTNALLRRYRAAAPRLNALGLDDPGLRICACLVCTPMGQPITVTTRASARQRAVLRGQSLDHGHGDRDLLPRRHRYRCAAARRARPALVRAGGDDGHRVLQHRDRRGAGRCVGRPRAQDHVARSSTLRVLRRRRGLVPSRLQHGSSGLQGRVVRERCLPVARMTLKPASAGPYGHDRPIVVLALLVAVVVPALIAIG